MTSNLVAVLFCAGLACAQDNGSASKPGATPPKAQPQDESTLVHRLETVTWSPATSELSWVVSLWDTSISVDKPVAKRNYSVQLNTATMKYEGEGRPFDPEEARSVRVLMYMVSVYAIESTMWWDAGDAETPAGKTPPEPDKGDKQKVSPRPGTVVLHGPVAANGVGHQR